MAGNPLQRKLIIAAPLTTINLMIIWEQVFSLSSEPIRTMSMHGCCETDLSIKEPIQRIL